MDIGLRRLECAENELFIHETPSTYPRLCRLTDGSILAGFTAFEPDGQRVLTIKRSTDDAATFEAHGEVARSSGDCDNLFLLELPASADSNESNPPTILAAFRNHDTDPDGTHTYFRITVCQSTDGGRTWTFLSQAAEKPAPFGLWEPFLRMAGTDDDDEIHMYFSEEMDTDDQDTMLVRSTDGGATWTATQRVTGEGEALRDGMVGVAAMRSCDEELEALILVMETTRLNTFSIEAVLSFDNAETFGSRQPVYVPKEGRNAGAPQITAFADGSVAVVFMTDEDEDDDPTWPSGATIKAIFGMLTPDGGLSWGEPQTISERLSSWPGIMHMSDASAMAVYESTSIIKSRLLSRVAE
ncbi:Sialidase [Chaetomium tenue]|uniref:Sialidase n=1 Tax=Chaetomium tenue TaxID=1854479 RepID=A0ACB7PG75_9PEZI|nr:Sialidase [Chaetomium globosum]